MDLAQLRTLIHVSELGSLNKASDRMRIAQPALSRQVRLLEEELNVQLFVRHGRGMVLTLAGSKVVDRARSIMREIADLKSDIECDRDDIAGKVVLGLPPSLGEIVTLPLARQVKAAFPGIRLTFSPGFGGHLMEWLQRGDIDLAVLFDPRPLKSVRSIPLLKEPLWLVGSTASGLRADTPIRFTEAARMQLILPGGKHSLRALLENVARECDVPLDVAFEVESLMTIKDLVVNDAGFAILPVSAVLREVAAGHMLACPLLDPSLARDLIIASSSDRVLSRAAQACETTIIKLVRTMKAEGALQSAG